MHGYHSLDLLSPILTGVIRVAWKERLNKVGKHADEEVGSQSNQQLRA